MSAEYNCIHEEQIQSQSRKIEALEVRADYKDKRIEEIDSKIEKMDKKLDNIAGNVNQLMLQSVKDDNTLNQRITAIEARQDTLFRIISVVSVLLVTLDFILKYIV